MPVTRTMTETAPTPAFHLVKPSGRLDASHAAGMRADFDAHFSEGGRLFVVNLVDVAYLSSSILRVLLIVHRRARRVGGVLAICKVQPQVMRVIQMVGFDQVFAIFDDEDAAAQRVLRVAGQQQ